MSQVTKQVTVVAQSAVNPNQRLEQVSFFDASGSPVTLVQTAAGLVIAGYVAGTDTAVAATDTLNAALGKLQAQITALTARVVALEAA